MHKVIYLYRFLPKVFQQLLSSDSIEDDKESPIICMKQ